MVMDTNLVLGLGYTSTDHRHRRPPFNLEQSETEPPSLTLALQPHASESRSVKPTKDPNPGTQFSSLSPLSSFSKAASDEDEDGSARKKLRLTKDQSALLEDRFKDHTTLNPKQKQALAKQLNLRPRQVEVWFQNRRARTKMKQTEAECELLKRRYEKLSDENRSLHKELRELKAYKLSLPLYMQFQTGAAVTLCPSCNRVSGGAYKESSKVSSAFAPPPATKPRFLKAFKLPPAC